MAVAVRSVAGMARSQDDTGKKGRRTTSGVSSELKMLAELHEKDILTDEKSQRAKAHLLNG
jgi:hypothetical protein